VNRSRREIGKQVFSHRYPLAADHDSAWSVNFRVEPSFSRGIEVPERPRPKLMIQASISGFMLRACPSCGVTNRVPAEHLADTGRCGDCRATLTPLSGPIEATGEIFHEVFKMRACPSRWIFGPIGAGLARWRRLKWKRSQRKWQDG
jgi:hypothetical protein